MLYGCPMAVIWMSHGCYMTCLMDIHITCLMDIHITAMRHLYAMIHGCLMAVIWMSHGCYMTCHGLSIWMAHETVHMDVSHGCYMDVS